MVAQLLVSPRKKEPTQNGGSIAAAFPIGSIGIRDIFDTQTPYDATIQCRSLARLHLRIQKTDELLPPMLYIEVAPDETRADEVELIDDDAEYESDITVEVAREAIEVGTDAAADGDIVRSFWLRKTAKESAASTLTIPVAIKIYSK